MDVEFIIPINKEALLESSSESYYVRDIYIISSLKDHLKTAKNAFHYDGPEAILNNFDTYFSVLYHGEKLGIDLISHVLNDLTRPCNQLCTYLNNIFSDGEVVEEMQLKTLNILKMLMYLLAQFTVLLENKLDTKEKTDLTNVKKGRKGKQKKSGDFAVEMDFNKKKQLDLLLSLLDQPIYKLWNPPVCEEQFINLISDVCFAHLTNPFIKHEKELSNTIFCIFGILIKNYNYSMTLTVRLAQAIIDHEHLEAIVPSGIKLLVEEYNCSGLVRELVRELTEWQSDENRNDVPGSKHCSFILTEMTAQMPGLMLPEVVYLLQYLNSNSYTLRICILSIITEVILNVLCKEDLSEEHTEIRNKLLEKLRNYIWDINAHVRSKVLQQWAKLHVEQAIPKDMQLQVLKKAVGRLQDKGINVRKCALQLVTTFVKYNLYAATLDLDYYKEELKKEMDKHNSFNLGLSSEVMDKLKQKEEEWSKIKDKVQEVIEKCLEAGEDSDEEEMQKDTAKSEKLLRAFLISGKYKKAFYLCRTLVTNDDKNRDEIEELEIEQRVEFYLTFMQSVYTEMNKEATDLINANLKQLAQLPPEKIEEMKKCEENIKYLSDAVEFLEIIESIFPMISILLNSASMTDVNEAIEFCIAAHQFKIKSAPKGLAAMLTQMNTTEQERKKVVIDAYRKVFLSYEGPAKDKPVVLVSRLIDLIKSINANDVQYLSHVIQQWAENNDLDNAVIQQLWHIFIGRGAVSGQNTSDDDRVVALDLLSMISGGKKSTVEKNVKLVAEIIFGEKGVEDPRFFIIGCNMLGLMEKDVNVTSEEPCFRVPIDDNMWESLSQSVLKIFLKKDPFCHSVITAAIQLIFKICQRPEMLCEKIIKNFESSMKDPNGNIIVNDKIDPTYLAFFCHLLGEVAIREFSYLDETVYKELKRRNYIKDQRKKTKKQKKKNESFNISKASASIRANTANNEDPDESYLEGATAEDVDAEFILNICECEVVTKNLLGAYVPMLVYILKHPHKIEDEILQASASQALMRYMTVSNVLCEKLIKLLMTTLEKSKYTSVKNNIFVSLADLLHRFPNMIEPWSSFIFKVVKDENVTVRMTAVSILSKLIMEDMIRVKGTIADLALCIVDESQEIVQMTEDFFAQLAQKGNAIYNVLPDILSQLTNDNNQIDEEIFRKVMSFLINLISKDKQIESLVEKLCIRCKMSQKRRVWRDIGFCLSILSYNDKSLIRLYENFVCYKHCLEDDEVYDLFMTIVHKNRNSTKDEIKDIVKKLESLIKTGEVTTDEAALNETKRKPSKGRRGKRARVSNDRSMD